MIEAEVYPTKSSPIGVTVYYTKSCPFCAKIKTFLKENKVSFISVDLEENKFAVNKLKEDLEEIRLPITKIKEEYVVGYNITKLKELLNLE